jgi:hypothetical protein
VEPSEFVLDEEDKPFEQLLLEVPSEFVDEEQLVPLFKEVLVVPREFVEDDEDNPFEQEVLDVPRELVEEEQLTFPADATPSIPVDTSKTKDKNRTTFLGFIS